MKKHRAPAWWRQFRAWWGNYFWIACPSCGEYFAGYEHGGGTLWTHGTAGSRSGKALCPLCPDERLAPGYDGYVTDIDIVRA